MRIARRLKEIPHLLKEAKVAVIPGKAFGRDDYVRLSFVTGMEQIQEGMNRLKDWIRNCGVHNSRKNIK